jgi:hypothetical protein
MPLPPPPPEPMVPYPFKNLLDEADSIFFTKVELVQARLSGPWVLFSRTDDQHILASQGFIAYKTKSLSSNGMPLVKFFATSETDGSLISHFVPLSSCTPGVIPVQGQERLPTSSDLLAFLASEAFSYPGLTPATEMGVLLTSKEAFTVSCAVPVVRGTGQSVSKALASPVRAPALQQDQSQDSSVAKPKHPGSVIQILESSYHPVHNLAPPFHGIEQPQPFLVPSKREAKVSVPSSSGMLKTARAGV